MFSLGPLRIYRQRSLQRVGETISLKEWTLVHSKYSLLAHNNLGVRAAAQEMEVLDSYHPFSMMDFKPTYPTLQKEALLCASIHSMLASNFESIPLYRCTDEAIF